MAAIMTGIVRPPKAPRTMRLNQSLSLGHSLTPPTIDANAVFGPPRFTPEQQTANPDQPMTRVVKDVLRVGKWNIGGPQDPVMMDFTPQILAALANSAAAQQATGHAINLGLSHGGDGLVVPTTELITPIDAVRVSGDWLWMSAYVTPEQAKTLNNPALKTSPGIMWDYFDGSGQQHPIALVHAAVTDRPVVAGQGKFLAMANAAPSTTPVKKGKSMDFASLKAALNKLFGAIGMSPLADAVDEASIVLVVEDRAASLGGETAPEETPAEGTTASDGQTPPMDGAGMNNARRRKVAQQVDIAAIVQQAISPLAQKVAALSNSMSLMKGGAANHAQAAFEAKCGELGKLGVAAATLQEKRELAGAMGWDIRLLNGLQPSVAMSNTSQKGATNQPPPNGTNPGGDALTNDQMEARLKARGIDPKLMPQ